MKMNVGISVVKTIDEQEEVNKESEKASESEGEVK